MNTARLRYVGLVVIVLVLVGSMVACDIGGGAAKPTITITAPTSDAQFEEGEEINVISSASDAKGVTRVELYVDGDLFRTDSSPSAEGETSLAMIQTWPAQDPGMHTLSVIAYNVDGAESEPWAVTIEVVAADGTPPPAATNTPEPPPSATDTPEPPPEATATTEPPPEETETPHEDTPEPSATPEPDLPDLVLDGLSVVPSDPDWGESLEVAVDIMNAGRAEAGPHKIVFRWGDGDFDVCEWSQPALPAMNGGTLRCTVDNIYTSYDTVATVDPDGEIDEEDEDNNSMTRRVEVAPAPPDLYISEIRLDPESPQQGSPVHVGVRIHNQGGTEASDFTVIWRSAGPTIGCEWDAAPIGPGGARWYQCEYTYSGWNPNYTTTGIVDADGEVDEIDEDNNELVLMVNVRPD